MPTPLPPAPPRLDLWPVALRSAERLRGTLVPCGPGLRGVGWPETPSVRAAALAEWLGDDCVAVRLTAAWIWGAARAPGRPLRVTTRERRRSARISTDWLRIHAMRCPDSETLGLCGFRVTTPLRTVLDLLHAQESFDLPERVACRLLLTTIEGGSATVAHSLARRTRPHLRRARERFAGLLGVTEDRPGGAPHAPFMR
ncbi:hypothetical protein J4H92_08365 [Leucobacter weissii]|uniref:AbiEi antitoxin C-terminal domain-containing protein n=1 Tax=Leucobacter weissii TaxID=1983706 RepID=A0A939SC02_9MICO|nr:hypothetical protein [Leucobacter weissii]MBO1901960.1 hypothetical protein [Leucobacter weissii]